MNINPPRLPLRAVDEMAESIGIRKPPNDVQKHIHWKFAESQFFLDSMEAKQDATLGGTRFNDFMWTVEHMADAQQFLFYFSAMLSAWKTVYYYIKTHCVEGEAKQWFESLKKNELLSAFSLLRNSDVHDGALNAGVQYTVNIGMQTTSQGFCLNGRVLLDRDCFKKEPHALELLTQRPLIPIAVDALKELRETVNAGVTAGLLS